MDPINKISKACMDNDREKMNSMMKTMKVELNSEENDLQGKKSLKSSYKDGLMPPMLYWK